MVSLLHIAVHMGGGVGKAISGVCISSQREYDTNIVLLEQPNDYSYVNQAKASGIIVYIMPERKQLENLISAADIVIVNWWGHPLMSRFLQNFPHIPCRCIIWNHINGCTYPYLQSDFLFKFARIMFTSPYSYCNNLWDEYERMRIKKLSAVVYGMGNFAPASIKPKVNYAHEDKFVIGYAGTIDYAKINRNFLDYYEEIIKRFSNVKICMLGHVSDEIRAEIAVRNLTEYFELPGHVNNIGDYMYQFDVFAYLLTPDNYATTENALLEAMAYGLPIVVLNNNLEKHIIKNDVNGYVVNNICDFREKIAFLYDSQNAERLGSAAREFVIREYSVDKNMGRYYKMCIETMSESKKNYDYADVLGSDGYETFVYFSQKDGKIISEAVQNNSSEALAKINPIFYSVNKGSLYQYLRYYPDDKRLRTAVDFLQRYGKGRYR